MIPATARAAAAAEYADLQRERGELLAILFVAEPCEVPDVFDALEGVEEESRRLLNGVA